MKGKNVIALCVQMCVFVTKITMLHNQHDFVCLLPLLIDHIFVLLMRKKNHEEINFQITDEETQWISRFRNCFYIIQSKFLSGAVEQR